MIAAARRDGLDVIDVEIVPEQHPIPADTADPALIAHEFASERIQIGDVPLRTIRETGTSRTLRVVESEMAANEIRDGHVAGRCAVGKFFAFSFRDADRKCSRRTAMLRIFVQTQEHPVRVLGSEGRDRSPLGSALRHLL